MSKRDIVVGLDIGTTKILCIVGEVVEYGIHPKLEIIGIGSASSIGLKKGVVVNIDATVKSVKKAVEEAEMAAGVEISSVYVGIAGGHIRSFNSTGMVAIKDGEVSEQDVQRMIDAAKAVAIPLDREVIHIIPQEYKIDDQSGIRDPIGMSGVRLEGRVHIVTGAVSSAQNIIKCVNKAGLNVAEICLQPIASSEAVLTADEKDLGVVLIDIGGGTSDIAIFKEGSIVYTSVVALGGNHMTNDLAVGLRTPFPEAEKLKVQKGFAQAVLAQADELVEVPGVGGRKAHTVSRREIAEIIEPRVEEMLNLLHHEVLKSGYQHLLSAGVVVTGGTSLLEGILESTERVFEMPVKRGYPAGVVGLLDWAQVPQFATGVGLMKYGAKGEAKSKFPIRENNIYSKVRGSMRTWVRELF